MSGKGKEERNKKKQKPKIKVNKDFDLQVGDLIIKINDVEAHDKNALIKALEDYPSSKKIVMRVLRDKRAVVIRKEIKETK